MVRVLRSLVLTLAAAAALWWLFADTVRHQRGGGSAPLRVCFWGTFEEYGMWQELGAEFQRRHPGIALKLEYVPGGRYETKIQQQLVGESAPDVIVYQDEPFFELVDEGNFVDLAPLLDAERAQLGEAGEDLEAWLTARYWPTAVQSFGDRLGEPTAGGGRRWRQFGMPIWGGCNLLYANAAIFARDGVRIAALPAGEGLRREPGSGPGALRWTVDDRQWTIADFERLTRDLTRDDDRDGFIEQFGYAGGPTVSWLPFHQMLGGDLLDPTRTRTLFHGPEVERSLALFQAWRWDDARRIEPREEMGAMTQSVAFLCGRAALFSAGPWEMPFLNAARVDYRVMHFPRDNISGRRATRITWDAVAVNARARRPAEAWALVRFLTRDRAAQDIIARMQRSIPGMRSAAATFMAGNPGSGVERFVEAAGDYAIMQPIPRHGWVLLTDAWMRTLDRVRHVIPERRLTPAEAIGYFYSQGDLHALLPAADPEAAKRYQDIYRRSGK